MVVTRFLAMYPKKDMSQEDAVRELEAGPAVEIVDATVRGILLVDLEDEAAESLRAAGWRLVEETFYTPAEGDGDDDAGSPTPGDGCV